MKASEVRDRERSGLPLSRKPNAMGVNPRTLGS